MATLQEILKKANVSDEHVALLAAYPDLDKLIASAEEVSAAQSGKATAEANAAAAIEKVKAWEEWRKNHWDDAADMTKTEAQRAQELQALKVKYSEVEAERNLLAAGGTGGEVDINTLKTELEKLGFVKKDDLPKLTPAEIESQMNGLSGSMQAMYARTAPLMHRYAKQFDKEFPMEQFLQYASTPERAKDLNATYAEFIKPALEQQAFEKEKADFAAEKAKFEAESIKAREHQAAGMNPTDDGGMPSPYQLMVDKPGENVIDKMRGESKNFGDMTLSTNVAKALKDGTLSQMVPGLLGRGATIN